MVKKIYDRSPQLKRKINESLFCKLDCRSSNSSIQEITFLSFLYTLSGVSSIDISAVPEVVYEVRKAISYAILKAKQLSIEIEFPPLLMASIEKSLLDENTIPELKSLFKRYVKYGAETFEIHIDSFDINSLNEQLTIVKELLPNQLVSISLSRKKLSNSNIVEIIKSGREIFKEKLIVEVDGLEENSFESDYNTTLQNISTADIINKQLKLKDRKFRHLPIILSGGTNSFTSLLAEQCGVPFNGITICDHSSRVLGLSNIEYSSISDFQIKSALASAVKLIK